MTPGQFEGLPLLTKPYYRIGEVSRLLDESTCTVRYYNESQDGEPWCGAFQESLDPPSDGFDDDEEAGGGSAWWSA